MTAVVAESSVDSLQTALDQIDLQIALEQYDEADKSLGYWIRKRNDAGHAVMALLGVNPRFTTLSFNASTLPWTWRAKRGAHLSPSARRELRRLQAVSL